MDSPHETFKKKTRTASNVIGKIPFCFYKFQVNKGLVINYGGGGGLQNGKIAGPKLFAPPLKTG